MTRFIVFFLLTTVAFVFGTEEECASDLIQETSSMPEEKLQEAVEAEAQDELENGLEADELEDGELGTDELENGDYDYDTDKDFSQYTANDFWYYLKCPELFKLTLPIHNQSTWMLLRGIYQGVVGHEESSIAPITHASGVQVPAHAAHVAGKGRGVFSNSTIREGDLVWNTRQSARFSYGEDYRNFLLALPPPLACDVMQWAYVMDLATGYDANSLDPDSHGGEEDEILAIAVDLDEGILMNDAEYLHDELDEKQRKNYNGVQNIGCVPESAKKYANGCNGNIFALRDIFEGEELIISYGDFAYSEGWEKFDL